MDIVRENHKFLWDEDDDNDDTWYVIFMLFHFYFSVQAVPYSLSSGLVHIERHCQRRVNATMMLAILVPLRTM